MFQEKELEKKFCNTAKALGMYPIKMNDLSRRGAPDRMVLCNHSQVFFVEFKREGETPTRLQETYHEFLRDMGFNVYICDRFEEIHDILDLYAF